MSKITYASMKLKTNTETTKINFNDNIDIEVLKYLPIEDKYNLVMVALEKSLLENIYNPIKLDMYFHLFLVYMYTNITFTDKQREDESKLYDTLQSNGLIDMIIEAIPEEEYDLLYTLLLDTKDAMEINRKSLSGIINSLISSLPKNAEAMQDILDNFDPEKFQNVLDFAKAANGGREI